MKNISYFLFNISLRRSFCLFKVLSSEQGNIKSDWQYLASLFVLFLIEACIFGADKTLYRAEQTYYKMFILIAYIVQ